MYKTLTNGKKIPTIGFGTDLIPDGETVINATKWALECGYRHIDNADCYKNETGVGIAIKNCIDRGILTREELFVTNKVPDWKQGYQSTIDCCLESLKKTGLEYFDLYLVHSPYRQNEKWKESVIDTYRAIEKLYEMGLVKAIGVSNFEIRHLEYILELAKIPPVINQIELHPQRQQKHVVEFCNKNNILLQGWGTLNQGRIFNNPLFIEIAEKNNVTPAQVALRWSFQKGNIPLVRSTKKERIENNLDIENFTLSKQDMTLLDALDGGEFSNWHHDGIIPTRIVHAQMQEQNYKKRYKLFGFITILKVKRNGADEKWFLFGFIPFMKTTKKIKK